jgi:hypothetical protein
LVLGLLVKLEIGISKVLEKRFVSKDNKDAVVTLRFFSEKGF